MNQAKKLNLAEGKEKTAKAFQEAMEKAEGFFLVLGVDWGDGTRIVGSFGGLMDRELPQRVVSRTMRMALALKGVIPFSEALKEGDEDEHVQ